MDSTIALISGAFLLIAGALGYKGRDKIGSFINSLSGGDNDAPVTTNNGDFIGGGEGEEVIYGGDGFLNSFFSTGASDKITALPDKARVNAQALADAKALLKLREGVRYVVYLDSVGKATVGVGHLVLPQDNLNLGDRITEARSNAFFDSDIQKAFNAGLAQAEEIGQGYNAEMITALTSVNFQLGTGWTTKFYNTWAKLKNGDYNGAIQNIQISLWAKQTPTRTNDFIKTLQRVA